MEIIVSYKRMVCKENKRKPKLFILTKTALATISIKNISSLRDTQAFKTALVIFLKNLYTSFRKSFEQKILVYIFEITVCINFILKSRQNWYIARNKKSKYRRCAGAHRGHFDFIVTQQDADFHVI